MSAPLSDEQLQAIRARHEASTRGPWRWFGQGGRKRKQVDLYLATTHSGRRFVVDFTRSGMNGAQPRFRSPRGLMADASTMLRYEVNYRDDVAGIDNPDAVALERSWEDVDDLLREVERLRGLLATPTDGSR